MIVKMTTAGTDQTTWKDMFICKYLFSVLGTWVHEREPQKKNVLIPPANLSLLVCSRESPVLGVEEVFWEKC